MVFRLTSGITQVSGHFGGAGVSAWNHPDVRSLCHSRNTSVPPKISGEHPPHAYVLTHTESGKVDRSLRPGITQMAGDSASDGHVTEELSTLLLQTIAGNPHKTGKPNTLAHDTTASIF